MPRVGVAISGGGHRATVWGAGAVLALGDAGLAPAITSVASVSGGSITNGVLAHDVDLGTASEEQIEATLGRMVRWVVHDGLFWFGDATNAWVSGFLQAASLLAGSLVGLMFAYLFAGREINPLWSLVFAVAGLALGLLLQRKLAGMGMPLGMRRWLIAYLLLGLGLPALALIWLTTYAHEWWLVGACLLATIVVGVVVWWFLRVFGGRALAVEAALDRVVFGGATLAGSDHVGVHHVFCTTDLQSGDALYFTPRLVSGYRPGFGTPGTFPLARAVQCSADLPGAFPPRVLPNRDNATFHFSREYDLHRPGFPASIDKLVVNDGGVYDNMADQWEQGYQARAERTGSPLPKDGGADFLVVVNAGKALGWQPWKAGRLLGDIPGLSRTINVLYDVSTSFRRQRLVSSWDNQGQSGSGPAGVLTHVATSPLSLVWRFHKGGGDAKQQAAADEALPIVEALADFDGWQRIADANAGVKTTLGRLEVDDVANLLWHAYVLTTVSLRVVHDLGPPLDPARLQRDRFVRLCQEAAGSR